MKGKAKKSCRIANSRKQLLHGEYHVEKIVDRRVRGRNIKYLVKWTGYPKSYNSWEPAKNLFKCHDLIIEFEKILNIGRKPNYITTILKIGMKPPYCITGVGKLRAEIFFEVQWNKGDLSRDIIGSWEANENWPMMVIRFYEERIKWVHENEQLEVEIDEGHHSDMDWLDGNDEDSFDEYDPRGEESDVDSGRGEDLEEDEREELVLMEADDYEWE